MACASQSVAVLIVLVAWVIAAGPQAEALDDAGIFSGMATALVAVVGLGVATVLTSSPDITLIAAACVERAWTSSLAHVIVAVMAGPPH